MTAKIPPQRLEIGPWFMGLFFVPDWVWNRTMVFDTSYAGGPAYVQYYMS